MSTFAAPLRVRGPIQNGDSGPSVDAGDVLASQTNTVDFTDTSNKSMFFLPANCQIIDFYVDTTTAFDAGTSNFLNVGVSGSIDSFVAEANVGAVGRSLGSAGATGQIANYADTGNTRIEVLAVYTPTGTAVTTGAARVTCVYAVKQTLPV